MMERGSWSREDAAWLYMSSGMENFGGMAMSGGADAVRNPDASENALIQPKFFYFSASRRRAAAGTEPGTQEMVSYRNTDALHCSRFVPVTDSSSRDWKKAKSTHPKVPV